MPYDTPLTTVNVGYLSTNYWVISASNSRILVDLGHPGSMGTMKARLKQMDIPLPEIRYTLATHYHIDHAGLGQELKLAGVALLAMDIQLPFIPLMKQFTKPQDHYMEISLDGNLVIPCAQSRALLSKIGISGEILPTPGQSDDSVSLVLDSGEAFTGDLTREEMAWGETAEVVKSSWQLLHQKGARLVFPGHGGIYDIGTE